MKPRKYKRWLTIGVNPSERTLRRARRIGLALVSCCKPGWCAWHALIFVGTPSQMRALERWWDERGMEWFSRKPSGAFDARDGDILDWDVVFAYLARR